MSGRPTTGIDTNGKAYVRLRHLIVQGIIAPGTALIETDLVARLGASRTPVRAALLRLAQEGFVVWEPNGARPGAAANRRASVAPLTASDQQEVFLMLGSLEATAARQAAALDAGTRDRLLDALERTNHALCDAVAAYPPALALAEDAHAAFHRAIVETAAGPRLSAEISLLALQAERYRRVYVPATMYAIAELARAHGLMTAAIRAGDVDGAEQATMGDWRLMSARSGEMIAALGERGVW